MQQEAPKQVIIADDWLNVQAGLRVLLDQQPDFQVVGQVTSGDELLAVVAADCPDLILLDWGLHDKGSGALLPALRQICPSVTVVVLSGRVDARPAALAAGSDAFISKTDPPDRLLAALRLLGKWESGHREHC